MRSVVYYYFERDFLPFIGYNFSGFEILMEVIDERNKKQISSSFSLRYFVIIILSSFIYKAVQETKSMLVQLYILIHLDH
jgi:hypothetical protein